MDYIEEAKRNLETKWEVNNGIAKIFTVVRKDLDERSDELDAWELIFIDDGGVRRHDTFIDCTAGRFDGLTEEDTDLLETCPEKNVVKSLLQYIEEGD